MKFKLTLFLVLMTALGYSQEQSVIPASPITREFDKYINQKVSLYNGLPDITIPIYEIKLKGITIPISLSYHASGIKFSQNSGQVGLGWVLNPRYSVNRTMTGNGDFGVQDSSAVDITSIELMSTKDRNQYLAGFYRGAPASPGGTMPFYTTQRDGEYDMYQYTIEGANGHFIMKDIVNNIPELLDNKGLKITNNIGGSTNNVVIVDGSGNKYEMGNFTGADNAVEYHGPIGTLSPNTSLSWLASKITTFQNEEVNFKYVPLQYTENNTSFGATLTNYSNSVYPQVSYPATESTTNYSTPILQEILTENEKLTFYNIGFNLQKIEIRNNQNELIKIFEFVYTEQSGYTFLSHLNILDSSLSKVQEYGFEYYPGPFYEAKTTFDDWGYTYERNGGLGANSIHKVLPTALNIDNISTGIAQLHPSNLLTEFDFQNKIVTVTPDYFSLKKIKYPTGGETEFQYESNAFGNGNAAGMRVKKIINSSSDGQKNLVREYKYGINESAIAYVNKPVLYSDYVQEGFCWYYYLTVYGAHFSYGTLYNYSNRPNTPETSDGTPSFFYPEVNEYDTELLAGGATKINGKTNYLFEVSPDWFDKNDNVATNLFYREGYSLDDQKTRKYFPRIEKRVIPYAQPYLKEKKVYVQTSNALSLIEKENFEYQVYKRATFKGLKVMPFVMNSQVPYYIGYFMDGQDPYDYVRISSFFDYANYWVTSGSQLLKEKKHTFYNPSGILESSSSYTYNGNDQLATEETIDSRFGKTITKYAYPIDYTNITSTDALSQGVANLQNRNILSPVIEKSIWKQWAGSSTQKLLSTSFTQFDATSPVVKGIYGIDNALPLTNFSPASVVNGALVKDTKYLAKVNFNYYDAKGNILEQQKANEAKDVYLWAYNGQYPVAKITGSDLTTVAQQINTTALNTLSSESLIREQVDTLRNRLKNTIGLVSGYTYKPLIGMSSATDPAGKTTYYEYDGIGRLAKIKDNEGQMVKAMSYNYSSTPIAVLNGPADPYQNTAVSQVFTRGNCQVGYTGGTLTYTVPAGKYTSVISQAYADAQAQNELKRYGQYNANIQGTCNNNNPFYNDAQSQNFTRNNCDDYTASDVIYTVAANTYTSNISKQDANSKAFSDIALNGQNYANTNGTCMPINPGSLKFINGRELILNGKLVNTTTNREYPLYALLNGTAAHNSGAILTVPEGNYSLQLYADQGEYPSGMWVGINSSLEEFSHSLTFNVQVDANGVIEVVVY